MNDSRSTDLALLLLRLVFGFSMIYGHGWGKLLRLFSGEPINFADPFGLGPAVSLILVVGAEVLCAGLIMLGLFTRWATIPLIITMLVAIFYRHLGDPFGQIEKALLFLTVFVGLLISGPGWYALDERWNWRR